MKRLRDFPNYAITSDGRVWSYRRALFLKPAANPKGYLFVRIRGKALENARIHRLVAENFLPRPTGCKYVNHKDGDKRNNEASNLEWCTARDNMLHSYKMGRVKNRGNAKLSSDQVVQIKSEIHAGKTIYSIAKQWHLNWQTIDDIAKGKTWSHVKVDTNC